ncbi:MAG: response regulator [bacterium]|nr:response regulator [bacterium]
MNIQTPEDNAFRKEIQETLKAIQPETAPTSTAAPASSTAKKRIMVVEDDATIRSIYGAVFRENGFDAISANDGQDAWDKMECGTIPDAIFTGLTMPRMTGLQLLEKIKAHPTWSKIPVIIFSHRGALEDKTRAEKLGAADFIMKISATPADVVRRIRSIFGEHEKLHIKLSANNKEHAELIDILKRQQMSSCMPNLNGEYTLEIESTSERGKFSLQIIC